MAAGDKISCRQFTSIVIDQQPVYDKEITKDERPFNAGLMGFYETGTFEAYSGVEHLFDRSNSVFPDVTRPFTATTSGYCVGTPCDLDANKIGMGNTRANYHLESQKWESDLLCFDDLMTKTRAKETLAMWIADTLKPTTNWITNAYLQRKAMELAGRKIVVTTPVAGQLPTFNFTWDAGGYVFLNLTNALTGLPIDATGLLTPNILEREVLPLYAVRATNASKDGFEALQLHTDEDTFHYLLKENPTLYPNWRFTNFDVGSQEYYKYGLSGKVGDYMVKVLLFGMRFNRVSAGRYQVVLPYKNVAATNGIKSIFNTDFQAARYTFSLINNPRALQFKAFSPEAVNPLMPFLVRSYGGAWKFAINDLGADCNGKPIANYEGNKGKWYTNYRWSIKPVHTEWLVAIFHMKQAPCLNIEIPCGDDPGYPTQVYDSSNALCPTVVTVQAVAAANGHYKTSATAVRCDGNDVAVGAIDQTTLALYVAALAAAWTAAGQAGTWTVLSATDKTIQLTGTTCGTVTVEWTL